MPSGDSLNRERLAGALAAGRLEWRKHVLQRLAERGIAQAAVLEVLRSGERIEDYPQDAPYPSALFLGWVEGKPLHAVAALDAEHGWAYIVTAYEPDQSISTRATAPGGHYETINIREPLPPLRR